MVYISIGQMKRSFRKIFRNNFLVDVEIICVFYMKIILLIGIYDNIYVIIKCVVGIVFGNINCVII